MKLRLFILFLFTFPSILFSQDAEPWNRRSSAGSPFSPRETFVRGRVQQRDGSPATGVTVRLIGANGSQTVITDNQGEFRFSDLPYGSYDLEAESGVLFIHRTLVLDIGAPDITLRFDVLAGSGSGSLRNSISVHALKVPDKARKLYEKALEQAEKQNSERALESLAKALAACSCYADALTLKSVLELSAAHPKLAADEAQQAIRCDGSNSQAYFALGAAFNDQQQYGDAIRALNEGIRFQPDAWQPYYELGRSYLALRRLPEALSQLKRAEVLAHSSFPPLHVVLASALLQVEDLASARTQLLIFLKAAPEHPEASRIRTLVTQIEARMESTPSHAK